MENQNKTFTGYILFDIAYQNNGVICRDDYSKACDNILIIDLEKYFEELLKEYFKPENKARIVVKQLLPL